MNKSNIVHAVIAVCMQGVVALITGNMWYGAFLAGGLFWGREHAQKQDNLADSSGRKVKDMKWHEGADMTKWSKDSILDFAAPLVATVAAALIVHTIL